jgi:hypothetical protein
MASLLQRSLKLSEYLIGRHHLDLIRVDLLATPLHFLEPGHIDSGVGQADTRRNLHPPIEARKSITATRPLLRRAAFGNLSGSANPAIYCRGERALQVLCFERAPFF